jgi:S1-C subfamily serine protease
MLIIGVFVDSPADRAGMQTGDIITAINGARITRVRNVLDIVASHKPGDEVMIEVLRDGDAMQLSLTTSERPSLPRK